MDPEREGDAPSLTPNLNERRLSFNQFEGGRGLEGASPAGPIEVEMLERKKPGRVARVIVRVQRATVGRLRKF